MSEKVLNELISVSNDLKELTPLNRALLRTKISELESNLMGQEQVDVPLTHRFSKNVYAREIAIPKDTLIVGKIHKHQNLNIISKGEVTFFSTDGVKKVKAPYTFVASPGVKRVIYAHEDTIWTTIHGTGETDLDKIEDEFIAKDYEEVYLNSAKTLDDVLSVLGATPEYLKAISENTQDLTHFPIGNCDIYIADSIIHGKGIFAAKTILKDEVIAVARVDGKRTPAGRYANHSSVPNAKMVLDSNGDVDLIAITDIQMETEIVTDYYFNYINTRSPLCLG